MFNNSGMAYNGDISLLRNFKGAPNIPDVCKLAEADLPTGIVKLNLQIIESAEIQAQGFLVNPTILATSLAAQRSQMEARARTAIPQQEKNPGNVLCKLLGCALCNTPNLCGQLIVSGNALPATLHTTKEDALIIPVINQVIKTQSYRKMQKPGGFGQGPATFAITD